MSPEAKRGPLTPAQAAEQQVQQIPDEVFGVFNTLITESLSLGRAKVLQKDVLDQLEVQGMDRRDVFSKGWLEVEDSYRAAGWGVRYNKPVAYAGESFEPYFEFIDHQDNS